MTMKERLATAINGICADGKIAILDEARARTEAIDPILERLGWDRFSEDFKREFSVSSGRVDYALFVRGKPEAFIEAKRPSEDLDPHQRQLLTYSALHGVRLAALTNGLSWWLYLPLQVGNFEARRFCQLHICNQDVSEVCDLLIEFLSRENVYAGAAVENAEARLTQLQEAKKVDNALPQAWEDLIAGPDNTLVELINEKVKGLTRLEATPERIKEFLVGVGQPAPEASSLVSASILISQETPRQHYPAWTRNISNLVTETGKSSRITKCFIFCGERFDVSSHRRVLPTLANEIYKRHRSEFHTVGMLGGWYDSEATHLKIPPEPIGDSGWYVYTNIRSDQIEARCHELVRLFKYRDEDLIIQAR